MSITAFLTITGWILLIIGIALGIIERENDIDVYSLDVLKLGLLFLALMCFLTNLFLIPLFGV